MIVCLYTTSDALNFVVNTVCLLQNLMHQTLGINIKKMLTQGSGIPVTSLGDVNWTESESWMINISKEIAKIWKSRMTGEWPGDDPAAACLPAPGQPLQLQRQGDGAYPRSLGVDLDFRVPRASPAFPPSNIVIKILDCESLLTRCCFKKPLQLKRIKKYHQKIPSLGYCC